LTIKEQNVTSLELTIGDQNFDSSELTIREQNVDESSNQCGLELVMVIICNLND
jgi:hypothetical protein